MYVAWTCLVRQLNWIEQFWNLPSVGSSPATVISCISYMTFQLQLTPPSYNRPSYDHKPTDRLIALTDDVHTVAVANTKWLISKSVGKVTYKYTVHIPSRPSVCLSCIVWLCSYCVAYSKDFLIIHTPMASAAARAYNWGLSVEPPAGVQGVRSPWSIEVFVFKTVISNASATVFARNDVSLLFELLLLI